MRLRSAAKLNYRLHHPTSNVSQLHRRRRVCDLLSFDFFMWIFSFISHHQSCKIASCSHRWCCEIFFVAFWGSPKIFWIEDFSPWHLFRFIFHRLENLETSPMIELKEKRSNRNVILTQINIFVTITWRLKMSRGNSNEFLWLWITVVDGEEETRINLFWKRVGDVNEWKFLFHVLLC